MQDYQRIVDDIRNSLYASGPEAAETVRAAAAAYADACEQLNQRLRKCGELLKSGLRSEALQQCEIEPSLLDVVAALDFPERDHWAQLLSRHGIAITPPLLMDVAADLNEAYAIEQPMETLLSRHRLLALARSPLKLRVKTLRELAEVDSNNSVWRDDLLTFERERFREIQRETTDAVAAGDVTAAAQLDRELQSSHWMEAPPATLLRLASDAYAKLTTRHARKQLERIERELNAAYSAFDVEPARRLRNQWNDFVPTSGLKDNDPLFQRVAPALDWLVQEDEKEQRGSDHVEAVAALERALDDEDPQNVLERLYHATVKDDQEVSDVLQNRYRSRVSALQTATRRRARLLLAGGTIVALLLTGLAGIFIVARLRASEVNRHADALQSLIDQKKISAASDYLDELRSNAPWVFGSATIAKLKTTVDEEEKRQAIRQIAFDGACQEAAAAAQKDLPDWDSLEQAERLLDKARELDLSGFESLTIASINSKLEKDRARLQTKENDRFTQDFGHLQGRLKHLELATRSPPAERQKAVKELGADVLSLERGRPRAGKSLRDQLALLSQRLKTIEDTLRDELKSQELLDAVTRAVGDSKAYQVALEAYVRERPDAPRSADFRRALEESPLLDSLAKFSDLAVAWRRYNHQQLDPKTAKLLIAQADKLLQSAADHPEAAAFRERLPYLEAIARRVDHENGRYIEQRLREYLNQPFMRNVGWMVRKNNGDRYYLKSKPNIDPAVPAGAFSRRVVNFELKEVPERFKPDEVQYTGPAPQAALADKALQLLSKLESANAEAQWERIFVELARAIRDDQQTDSLLRFLLLRQTLEIGSQGSKCFEIAFTAQNKHLLAAKLNPLACWLDPQDKEASDARKSADIALKELPAFQDAEKRLTQAWQELASSAGRNYQWTGWLIQGENGEWECPMPRTPNKHGDLFVVHRKSDNTQLEINHVGTVDGGGVRLSASPEAPVQGRPVFFVEAATTSKSSL